LFLIATIASGPPAAIASGGFLFARVYQAIFYSAAVGVACQTAMLRNAFRFHRWLFERRGSFGRKLVNPSE